MGDPFSDVLGGAISSVTDVIGGQLAAAQNRQSQRYSTDVAREFAQNGIQWRVADAKAAGLHPLAALGMMPAQSTPMILGDTGGEGLAHAGQSIGNALTRQQSTEDKSLENAQLQLLHAQTAETDARRVAIMSDIGLKSQAAGQGTGLGPQHESNIEGQAPNVPLDRASGMIDLKGAPIISHKDSQPHMQSGTIPGFAEMRLHPNLKWTLPAGEGQEATMEMWNEMPTWAKALNFVYNERKYGPGWFKNWMKVQTGIDPDPLPKGKTNTLIQPSVKDSIDRTIKKFQDVPRRFKKSFREMRKNMP